MTDFPIPVQPLTPDKARRLVCEGCAFERDAADDELTLCEGLPPCPSCAGMLTWKYQEADRCKGCGEVGWFPETLGGCCSRPCMLQAEYAALLRAGS